MITAFEPVLANEFTESSIQALSAAVSQATALADMTSLLSTNTLQFDNVVSGCINLINSKDTTLKKKTAVLVAISNMAKLDIARDHLMRHIHKINSNFEDQLDEKERSAVTLGTSLGKLHELVLLIVMRCVRHKLSASSLLEFCNYQLHLALEIITSLLKVTTYEPDVITNCVSCLAGLTLPQSYVTSTTSEISNTAFLSEVVEPLLSKTISMAIMPTLCDALARVVTSCSHVTFIALQRYLFNLYSFTTDGTTFRQHVMVVANLPGKVILPYLARVAKEVNESKTSRTPIDQALLGSRSAVKIATLIVFNMLARSHPVRRAMVPCADLLSAISVDDVVKDEKSIRLLIDILLLHVNLNTFEGELDIPDYESMDPKCLGRNVMMEVSRVLSELSPANLNTVHETVSQLKGIVEPIDRTSASYLILTNLIEGFQKEKEEKKSNEALPSAGSSTITTSLGDLPSLHRAPSDTGAVVSSETQSKVPLHHHRTHHAHLVQQAPTHIPKEFSCAINGHMMKVPVRTPCGNVYDKETLDKFIARVGWVEPLTGKPLKPEDVVVDSALQKKITEYLIRSAAEANKEDDLYEF